MEKNNFKWQIWHIHLLTVLVVLVTFILWFNYYKQMRLIEVNESKYDIVGRGQKIKEAVFIDDGKAVALSLKYHSGSKGYESYPLITKSHIVLSDYKLYKSPDKTKDVEEYFYLRTYSTKNAKLGQEESIDLLKLLKEAGYSNFKEIGKGSYVDGGDDVLPLVLKNDKEVYLNLNQKTISPKKPKVAFERGYEDDFGKMLSLTDDVLELKTPESYVRANEIKLYEKKILFDTLSIDYGQLSVDNSFEREYLGKDKLITSSFHGRTTGISDVGDILENDGRIYFLKEKMSLEDYKEAHQWFDEEIDITWKIAEYNSKDGQEHVVRNYQEFLQWVKEERLNEKAN